MRRALPPLLLVLLAALFLAFYLPFRTAPLLDVGNVPERYGPRSGALTANVTGALTRHARSAEWSLNGGPWQPVGRGFPRALAGAFVIEMAPEALRIGENRLALRGRAWLRPPEERTVSFRYDPTPVALPLKFDWGAESLEAQDGIWERLKVAEEWRVRPRPGTEEYDRLLLLTGAFPAGRRIRAEATLRSHDRALPWGFGVISLWGGHADDGTERPRRGWRFALTWYYSYQNSVGQEFSTKEGGSPAAWVNGYRNFVPKVGVTYRMLVECWSEEDPQGTRRRHLQRSKWWAAGEDEPGSWMTLRDDEGAPLPRGDYACGLLAHRCQVEFGPVSIEAMGPPR